MLENTDMQILDELSKNSRITMKEWGEKVHLPGPATSARVTRLEEDIGVIEGYTIKVNRVKLGCFIHAFITIITESIFHQPYLSFIKTQEKYLINNYKLNSLMV
ncbi:AsnC family transcriptional regulator [Bacillus sp. B15-48]|nr:AsnC family transcriptional regulator [Bacillus sp. B15-48]